MPERSKLQEGVLEVLIELLGNTSVIWTSKVATPIKVGRIVGEISGLKPLLQ
ncbi:hypothetical protein QUA70_25980 [Microcoleus sp. LAD1_D5]|uniref:hypothetical protein n=1 Tax=Microcoleus sp. LAD1_D5 TaxID=2818813 RepID=UPI002FD720C1